MNTHIILLRGVMPTGKNKVPMAKLREVLSNAGFENVRTYIQSGNAVLESELSASEVEKNVAAVIKTQIGPELVVVVRTSEQLQKVLDENPFQDGFDISRVFFVFFAQTPSEIVVQNFLTQDFGEEKIVISNESAYMYIPGTYGRGKLSNNFLERKLGVSATTRNFNTTKKLVEMGKKKI